MTKKTKPDWEAIERDYRLGSFTLRELEAKHGVANTTIMRRAKKEDWTQDLSDAVRQATRAALVKEVVQQTQQESCSAAQQNAATAVLAVAEVNKEVILRHRQDISKTRNVALTLLEELAFTTTRQDELERILELSITEDMDEQQVDELRASFRRLMGLNSRVGSAQKLADTLTKLQALERKAFDLDKETADDKPKGGELSDLMDFLREGAGRIRPGAQ